MQFVPECSKTQKMCDKAVDACPPTFDYVRDQYNTQEIGHKALFNDPFLLKYCPDRFKTQEMCDKAADGFLPTLRFVPDWFFTSIMIKKLDDALFANGDIIFVI